MVVLIFNVIFVGPGLVVGALVSVSSVLVQEPALSGLSQLSDAAILAVPAPPVPVGMYLICFFLYRVYKFFFVVISCI